MTEGTSFDVFASSNVVEFAPWSTGLEDAELSLVHLDYREGPFVDYDLNLLDCASLGIDTVSPDRLQVLFLRRDRPAAFRITFTNVLAFRLLDEGGLLQLWNASSISPRPAYATFRVRGHAWQSESPLVWFHGNDRNCFSYMVATMDECLEVVTNDVPVIEAVEKATR